MVCVGATIAVPAASATSAASAIRPAPAPKPGHPVPYTFLAGILAAPTGPDTPPPGANDFSCKPSAEHPEPVILVHGLLATQTDNWQTISPLLANEGYCVFALTYGQVDATTNPLLHFVGGLAPMEDSAKELGAFVDTVLAATGAAKVDLVGHSEGATMPYWYLKFDGGAAKVAKMVGISPAVHGTHIADLASVANVFFPDAGASTVGSFCASCLEFAPDSAFMRKLDEGGVAVRGVAYTQIMTRYDELVVPYSSGVVTARNSRNIVVQDQCPIDFADHVAIVADRTAADDVLNALGPAHPRRVRCTLTLPFIG
jgi:triacylglycerol lipase